MSRLGCAVVVVLAVAASACARAQATTATGGPDLAPPPPPPHTIVPLEVEAERPAPPPSEPSPVIVKPAARPAVPKTEKPAEKPEAAAPAQPPPVAAPPLQTTSNVAELESSIRAKMVQASRDLDRTDYRALSAERRLQYDTAKRFVQQADDALKVKPAVLSGSPTRRDGARGRQPACTRVNAGVPAP